MKKILFIIITLVVFLNLGRVIDLTEKPKPTDIIVVLGGYKDTRIKEGLNLYIHNFSNTEKIIFPSKKYTKDVLKKETATPILSLYGYFCGLIWFENSFQIATIWKQKELSYGKNPKRAIQKK